ncbi:MAG: putative transposase DNA-binding domain [Phormidesmis priestleyi Ana]|uniref:Putative transposase DNA-binding domain n=1 Tax=Phormidesmis priestleyi Ana TaxID=1666911 RepID=A0A0P8DFK1_9CYAN|nr:MAG: putative transposase DNA-binding domain [Phormidesmis priestleyi Ana]
MQTPLQDSLTDAVANLPTRPSSISAESVECPKCGKRSIVRRSANMFNCLNCNFHKELPPLPLSSSHRHTSQRLYKSLEQLPTHSLTHLSDSQADQPLNRKIAAIIQASEREDEARRRTLSRAEQEPEKEDGIQAFIFSVIAVLIGLILL